MKKKIAIFAITLLLIFTLTGCGDYNAPIHEGVGWYEKITVVPLGYVLQFFASLFNNSFAAGIIFLTIIVRTIAWPIYAKTNDFSMKMSLMNPEMQKIQAKYITRKDPESQQKMQLEMMALYKKYGVNPLGCLFPFLQMPIFMAMYATVVRISIAATYEQNDLGQEVIKYESIFFGGANSTLNKNLFGLIDLSQSSFGNGFNVGIFILALLVGVTMGVLQYLSTKKPSYAKNIPNPVQSQQAESMNKMMKFMNVFMVIMMVAMAFQNGALAFYWIIGNIYSIGQNLVNRFLSEKKYKKMKDNLSV